MINLLGEFECKIESKGRIKLPVGLKKQIVLENPERFVINRGIEKCLILYPSKVWESITEDVNKLNLYNKKNREFVRFFYGGANELFLDNSDRFLIPKRLLEYAGISNEVILLAHGTQIEIWAKEAYDNDYQNVPEDFDLLAEEVMGTNNNLKTNQ